MLIWDLYLESLTFIIKRFLLTKNDYMYSYISNQILLIKVGGNAKAVMYKEVSTNTLLLKTIFIFK